jgi:proline iminopeptidase
MAHLIPGEYDVRLNGVPIHYTVRGPRRDAPVIITHSGGPGMDARGWDDFAGIDDFATIVAMQFAFTYPDSLSKLIVFDTSAYVGEFLGDIEGAVQEFKNEPWFEKSFAALQAEWAGEYQSDEDMARLWAEEMKFYFKRFDERAKAYHERTKDLPIRIASLKTFNDKEAATMDLRPHLHKITVPTLVIVGRHDFITNVAMAEEIVKHIPNARLEIFEGSGHFALVEEPEKFYRVIKEFVEI